LYFLYSNICVKMSTLRRINKKLFQIWHSSRIFTRTIWLTFRQLELVRFREWNFLGPLNLPCFWYKFNLLNETEKSYITPTKLRHGSTNLCLHAFGRLGRWIESGGVEKIPKFHCKTNIPAISYSDFCFICN
jgi:hypothetical protein